MQKTSADLQFPRHAEIPDDGKRYTDLAKSICLDDEARCPRPCRLCDGFDRFVVNVAESLRDRKGLIRVLGFKVGLYWLPSLALQLSKLDRH